MFRDWSPREKLLAAAVAVLAILYFSDARPALIRDAAAQSESNVQDMLSSSPDFKAYTIWGDGAGNVFVSDGYGVFRSPQHGTPGTWSCVLR